ncbi:MAG: division/cell wall cluster transcriptional repressor MraZ [Clostridia bacterium]|nr:division/cell wall cluster transcriptional repressor MraZ [Clostridia bacterium]
MFIGSYRYALDSKNRVSVPAKLREELGSDLVLVRDIRQHCLRVYTPEQWRERVAEISKMPARVADAALRKLNSSACELSADTQGRILIPSSLLGLVNIKKDIVFVGFVNYAELWGAEEYDAYMGAEDFDSLKDTLEEFGF